MEGPIAPKSGPLAGMRVIELAHIMAGPACGVMLADMGADVIKVEKPTGDDSRRFVPPKVGDESAAYMMMNRNKRGISLDLKDPAAVEVLRTLLADADIVVDAMGICAALANRVQTGRGQKVDTSLFEAAIVQTYWQSAIAFATGQKPEPLGSAHPINAPYQAFQTSDGWINIGAANQSNWLRFLTVIEATELDHDPRFSSNAVRQQNLPELIVLLNERLLKDTTENWLKRC